jgi:hypothetical protein
MKTTCHWRKHHLLLKERGSTREWEEDHNMNQFRDSIADGLFSRM